jgi:hypothetical protein
MLYKKIYGLFKTLPLESLTLNFICRVTNTNEEIVKPILKQLVKENIIKGKVKFRLKSVPKYIETIHK